MRGSDEEYLTHMEAAFGLCTCSYPDDCDAEGDPGCALCQALDPEWPCPSEMDYDRLDGQPSPLPKIADA